MMTYFCLMAASSNIGHVEHFLHPVSTPRLQLLHQPLTSFPPPRHPPCHHLATILKVAGGDIRLFGVMLPLEVAHFIWCCRFLEVALLSPSEPARRWAAARFIDDLGVLILWLFPLWLDLVSESEVRADDARTETAETAAFDVEAASSRGSAPWHRDRLMLSAFPCPPFPCSPSPGGGS